MTAGMVGGGEEGGRGTVYSVRGGANLIPVVAMTTGRSDDESSRENMSL